MSKCPGTQSKKAGFEKACQDCPNASYCQSEKIPDPSIDIIKQKFTNIPHIIAIMSGKGGVGKSFISKNIAKSISTYKKVLLLDFDLTGPSIPRLTKTENQILYESNDILYPIKLTDSFYCLSVGHFSLDIKTVNSQLKNDIIKQILMNIDLSNIDTIIIDTPPGVSDEHLGLVNYMKIKAIMVTTPQQIAFADVIRQIDFCKRSGIEILGIIENMKGLVCNGCGHHNFVFEGGNQVMEYCERNDIRYLGGIALNQDIARKSDTGEDIEDPIFEKIAKSII